MVAGLETDNTHTETLRIFELDGMKCDTFPAQGSCNVNFLSFSSKEFKIFTEKHKVNPNEGGSLFFLFFFSIYPPKGQANATHDGQPLTSGVPLRKSKKRVVALR